MEKAFRGSGSYAFVGSQDQDQDLDSVGEVQDGKGPKGLRLRKEVACPC